jgi:hypothetical protein
MVPIRRREAIMIATASLTSMPERPRPGDRVCWRNPEQARACGWAAIFGPGPYAVVRVVDHSGHGLAAGLVLRTAIGEQEISEVWLALVDEPGSDSARRCGATGIECAGR